MEIGGIFNRWEYVIAGDPIRQVGAAEEYAQRGDIILSPEAQAIMHPLPLPARPLPLPDWDTVPNLAAVEANLRRFVPGPVLGWLDRGLTAWVPVLRPLTVLFIGVAGLQYGRPDVAERLHTFLRTTQRTLYRFEGTLRQFIVDDKGTVVMALFGAPPFAHEDDPARAALCALHLREAAIEQTLDLAMGIATGQVFSGPVGGKARYEYTAMGDTVNLAARLMGKAGHGHILCEFDTYRSARTQIHFETLAPIRVKGKTDLIRVYCPLHSVVTWLQSAGSAGADLVADDPTSLAGITLQKNSLVGRRDELAHIHAAFNATVNGQSQVLIVEGDAGIGKSRLVTTLTRITKEQGLVWFIGAGQSIERQTPYRAWRDVLHFYFGLDQAKTVAEKHARIRTVLKEIAPEQWQRMSLLNDVLNLGLPGNFFTHSLDPQLRQQVLMAFVLALLRAWGSNHPLILIFEDAQWLDSLSWSLLVEVARTFSAVAQPCLLAIITRPLEEHNVGADSLTQIKALPIAQTLILPPLDTEAVAQLAADRLNVPLNVLPRPVIDLVQRWAEGNPFYAEEVIFALRDQGTLILEEDETGCVQCRIQGDLGQTLRSLPDSIQGLVLARIDRQPPERQLVLKTASVIGRTFSYAPLRYVLERKMAISDTALKPHLEALAKLNLTPLQVPEPDLTYTFKHIITQEVAYETLLFSQRRMLHRIVAEWYEQDLPANSLTDGVASRGPSKVNLPLLAHHYRQAGDTAKERHYARLSGEQAAAQFANTEAVRYLSRALVLTPDEATIARYKILLAREHVFALQGDHDAQACDLAQLAELAERLEPASQAEVALRQARYAEVAGDYDQAIAAAQQAIALAQPLDDQRQGAKGHLMWGRALWLQGKCEAAIPQLETALMLARRTDYGQVEANGIRSLGVIAYYQGNHKGGTLCFQQALAVFRRIGDRRGEGGALNNLGVVFYNQGDYAQAQVYYQQGLTINRIVGHRQGEGRAVGNLGIIAHNLGDYATARDYYEQALGIYREVAYRQGISTLLSYLSLLYHHQEEHAQALRHGQQALDLAQDLRDSLAQGFALTNMGHAHMALGHLAKAANVYQQAYAVRFEAGQRHVALESLAGLADVQFAQDDMDEAQANVQVILEHLALNTLVGTIEPLRIYWTCYRILRAIHDDRAANVLIQAHTHLQERAEHLSDDTQWHSFLENVAVHREIIKAWKALAQDAGAW